MYTCFNLFFPFFLRSIRCSYVSRRNVPCMCCKCENLVIKYVSFRWEKKLCVVCVFLHYNCLDRWALILLGGPMQEITPFSLDDLHKTESIRVQKRYTIEITCRKNAVWKIPCHYDCVSLCVRTTRLECACASVFSHRKHMNNTLCIHVHNTHTTATWIT